MTKRNKITILVILLSGAFVYFIFNLVSHSTKIHSVVLNQSGFSPVTTTIQKGDTVVFTSTGEGDFWPASDLHPSHGLYPEFDPKQPIHGGDSWSFVFDKPGRWVFHNHLKADQKGVIIVKGKTDFSASKITKVVDCENISERSDKVKCWNELMDYTLEKQGMKGGFSLITSLLKADATFEPECHTFAHEVGAKAYNLFTNHQDLDLDTQTTLCGYGFYHGFTETMAFDGGRIQEARDFCALVVDKLHDQLSDIEGQCYHGFGHGSVNIHDETLWGNELAMIAPAVKLCSAVAQNSEQLFRCGTGLYDSISIGYFRHNYKLEMNPSNPFSLCDKQKVKELKRACYVSMDPALLLLVNLDFPKAATYIEAIPDDSDAALTMGSLALPLYWIRNQRGEKAAIEMEKYYKTKGVNDCNKLQSRLRIPCIQNIAYALSTDENATNQYKEGLNFCRSSLLSPEEKEVCLRTVWGAVRVAFPKSQIHTMCEKESLPEEKQYCSD